MLDHLAKPPIKSGAIEFWALKVRELASCPNVYAKLSGLVTEADWQTWKTGDIQPYLDIAFECFGSGRLMIGSDWPVCNVAASYQRAMELIKDYLASSGAKNAKRFSVVTQPNSGDCRAENRSAKRDESPAMFYNSPGRILSQVLAV